MLLKHNLFGYVPKHGDIKIRKKFSVFSYYTVYLFSVWNNKKSKWEKVTKQEISNSFFDKKAKEIINNILWSLQYAGEIDSDYVPVVIDIHHKTVNKCTVYGEGKWW